MITLKKVCRMKGKNKRLVDLVAYQEGSIVSRTIIDKEKGTVTLFAFDKEQGLSEHISPYDAIAYILDGEVEIVISNETLHVGQGEMVIMRLINRML
jgi:quercetin dioxygenase-like cupin family protein